MKKTAKGVHLLSSWTNIEGSVCDKQRQLTISLYIPQRSGNMIQEHTSGCEFPHLTSFNRPRQLAHGANLVYRRCGSALCGSSLKFVLSRVTK